MDNSLELIKLCKWRIVSFKFLNYYKINIRIDRRELLKKI